MFVFHERQNRIVHRDEMLAPNRRKHDERNLRWKGGFLQTEDEKVKWIGNATLNEQLRLSSKTVRIGL